ncbi:hypothetical protein BN2476_2050001 [Paraburkholderia piptadeniae]|uniref:Uncharacterized protein n=1 Tax=Paraburkholderia piptadeniae TaxID=1701573 RepID=A0A1N7SXK4_9BURK|nr:hypothetical protein BN2476_2050001 [Paraburkholderia piptadeniae]
MCSLLKSTRTGGPECTGIKVRVVLREKTKVSKPMTEIVCSYRCYRGGRYDKDDTRPDLFQ